MLRKNITGHRKDIEMLENYFSLFKFMSWPRNILEFGVDQGGSLLLWNDLFAPDLIIGFDHAFPNKKFYDLSKGMPIKIYEFEQMDIKSIVEARGKIKALEFDFIIDDCAHNGTAMKNTLFAFWDLLAPGGMYVAEDWPCDATSVRFYEKSESYAEALEAQLFKYSTLVAFKK